MADINTTSITDLPTDPSIGGTVGGTIGESIGESIGVNGKQTNSVPLDQGTISQIVNSLQQASVSGATTLPSRDISLHTDQITQDEQVHANYVPPPTTTDYIEDQEEDIHNYYKNEQTQNSLDSIYDELQAPLLLGVLYFLFQLPFFKKTFFKYLPFFCHADGNYNFNGLLFTCSLFGFIFYSLSKTVKQFSKF